jgi:hypothetical protein
MPIHYANNIIVYTKCMCAVRPTQQNKTNTTHLYGQALLDLGDIALRQRRLGLGLHLCLGRQLVPAGTKEQNQYKQKPKI